MMIISDPINKKSLQRLMRAKVEELDRRPTVALRQGSVPEGKKEFTLEELSNMRMDMHPS